MRSRSIALARLRLRVHRSAVVYWLLVGLVGAVTLIAVNGLIRRAGAASARTGPSQDVLVATRDLRAGQSLHGAVTRQVRPASALPRHVLTAEPPGGVATSFIAAGEPLVAERVSGAGSHGGAAAGPAALLPPGTVGVAVPLDQASPAIRVGDRVALLAATPGDGLGAGTDGQPSAPADAPGAGTATGPRSPLLTEAATVIDTSPSALTVAVRQDDLGRVASALAGGHVTVALQRPG